MHVKSIHDLASAARFRRLELGLSQAELAARARVSRDWVNSFEAGKSTVELNLVLRILEVRDLRVEVGGPAGPPDSHPAESADLDALLDEYGQR